MSNRLSHFISYWCQEQSWNQGFTWAQRWVCRKCHNGLFSYRRYAGAGFPQGKSCKSWDRYLVLQLLICTTSCFCSNSQNKGSLAGVLSIKTQAFVAQLKTNLAKSGTGSTCVLGEVYKLDQKQTKQYPRRCLRTVKAASWCGVGVAAAKTVKRWTGLMELLFVAKAGKQEGWD